MKQLLIPTNEQCPFRTIDGICEHPERPNTGLKPWCFTRTQSVPFWCPLKDAPDCPDCGSCDGSCQKGDSEPVLTTDEEIDQIIIAIKALEKRFWMAENRIKCVRAAALLEDIDLDKEVDPE